MMWYCVLRVVCTCMHRLNRVCVFIVKCFSFVYLSFLGRHESKFSPETYDFIPHLLCQSNFVFFISINFEMGEIDRFHRFIIIKLFLLVDYLATVHIFSIQGNRSKLYHPVFRRWHILLFNSIYYLKYIHYYYSRLYLFIKLYLIKIRAAY
jgi:hypothetical protein